MENNNNKSGWTEAKNPLTFNKRGETVAPRHHEVAQKKAFNDEFGGKRVSITPKQNIKFHFNISDADTDKFTDIVLIEFRKEYGQIEVSISRDENNKTVVEIPRENALQFHDYLLSKNQKYGTTDLDTLIELQEDSLGKNPHENAWNIPAGIETRLRRLR